MSYFGNDFDRSSRASIGSISFFESVTPSGQVLSLSDADLAAVLFGPIAPENPATPVAGPSLLADTAPTLHGVEVGTSPATPAANPTVVNTVFQIDPNAPPPTATTLEFTNGQQQGPLVTTLQNPVQAPQMTPQEALDRLQNRPQIIVDSSTPPVVQTAPAAPVTQAGVLTSTRPGNEWIYNTTANGLFVPFMTKTAYAAMIAANNIANGSTSGGWTFGATLGEYASVIGYIPGAIVGWAAGQANTIGTNYNNLHGNGQNQVTSIIVGVAGWAAGPVAEVFDHVGGRLETVYTQQRSDGSIVGAGFTTYRYAVATIVGVADVDEAIRGTDIQNNQPLTPMERWSRGLIGFGSLILSVVPLIPRSPTTITGTGTGIVDDAARSRAASQTRSRLQGEQAERIPNDLQGRTNRTAPEVPEVPERPSTGGMSVEGAGDATKGMNRGGGHAIRHFEGTLIPNTGSLASRVDAFGDVVRPILQNPDHVAAWKIGGVNGNAYVGTTSNGRQVVVIIANEGPYTGKVLSAFFPDADQLAIMLGR